MQIIFLVFGINKIQPKVSVRKPGVSKKAPAIRIAIPSNIENIGILLDLISSNALLKILIPWLLTNIAPIIPVIIIIKIVFHKPIYFPTVMNNITSIIGIAMKNKKNMFAYWKK